MSIKDKEKYIATRLSDIREKDPDTASDINLLDFAKMCLITEEDYDNLIEYLEKHPYATRADVTCYLFDLPD